MGPALLDSAAVVASPGAGDSVDTAPRPPVSPGSPATAIGMADPCRRGYRDLFCHRSGERRDGRAAQPLGLLSRSRTVSDALVAQVLEWTGFLLSVLRFHPRDQLRFGIAGAAGAAASRDRTAQRAALECPAQRSAETD